MPYQNRVTPTGEILAIPLRGAWTGNRGNLHEGKEIVRSRKGDHWVTCALEFKGRHNVQWEPRRLTWLFFHDEAVSFAAGHRPCGECRHADYAAYRNAWADTVSGDIPTARQMSKQLHDERLIKGTSRRRLHEMDWATLPDGAFVLRDGAPAVVVGSELADWGIEGYRSRHPRPVRGTVDVVTPPSTVAILRSGYPVQIDDGAR